MDASLSFVFFLYIPVNIRTISVRCHLHHFPRPILCLSQTMLVDTPDIFLGQMSLSFVAFSQVHMQVEEPLLTVIVPLVLQGDQGDQGPRVSRAC